jgi:hypothetical protein
MQALTPNVVMAKAFLNALDPTGTFTFQTFDDNKERKDGRLARILHGTLDEHLATLTKLQQQGAGVFVMVNEGDGKGRAATNVLRVRAHVLDLDGAPLEPAMQSELPPHIVVESSPQKWHAYWLIKDCPLGEFKVRQHALAARFKGDKAICDLPRVMRLPGFWHQKDTPFQTRLIKPTFQG